MNKIEIAYTFDALPEHIQILLYRVANVFFTSHYNDYVTFQGGHLLYFYNEQRIVPMTLFNTKGFRHGSFVSEIFPIDGINDIITNQMFIDSVVKYIKKLRIVDWIDISPASSMFNVFPTNSIRIPWGNLVIDLTLPEDIIMANMCTSHRYEIRRAQRDGGYVKFGNIDLLPEYLLLDKMTWKRSDETVDHAEYFSSILKMLKKNAFIAISYNKDGCAQSGMLSYYNTACLYYMFGASVDKPALGSVKLLHWEAIREMKRKGVLQYCFVGYRIDVDKNSKLAGIQRFKEGFGGELIRGYMFKCEIRPLKYRFYKFLVKLKTGKKVLDAVDVERLKWKSINA